MPPLQVQATWYWSLRSRGLGPALRLGTVATWAAATLTACRFKCEPLCKVSKEHKGLGLRSGVGERSGRGDAYRFRCGPLGVVAKGPYRRYASGCWPSWACQTHGPRAMWVKTAVNEESSGLQA